MKEIAITRGMVTLVDDEDFEWLNQWKWCAHKCRNGVYVIRTKRLSECDGTGSILMHRKIMGGPIGMLIDYRDRNSLNNQRFNLRACGHSQSMANRWCGSKSGFKGVVIRLDCVGFGAQISFKGKNTNLGLFDSAELAARAYDKAATLLYGEFALTNKMMGLIS